MDKFEKRDLGENGRTYVREHLTNINVFCTALLEVFNSAPGEVFTFAPANTPFERLLEFELGGLLPENSSGVGAVALPDGSTLIPVISLIEEQAKFLRETVDRVRGAVCIVDDFNPRWSDQAWYLGPSAFGVGEEVYHLLTSAHTDDDFQSAIFSGSTIWHGVAAVCGVAPKLNQARVSTPAALEQCAATALLITCTAYDGEGFLVWRRKSS